MRVFALPRDGNPYQELLYGELRGLGFEVRYLADRTPSRTLNLLLLPTELLYARLSGGGVVHLHWVFGFGLPGGPRTRWLARRWYDVVLAVIGLLRLPLVWTAHNVLPHDQVFPDDLAARRALVRRCALVIAHDEAALRRLDGLGLVPARAAVIPHGSYPAPAVPPPGATRERTLLFFGRVAPYKGVRELVAAFRALPAGHRARLRIVGSCPDPALAEELRAAAGAGVELDLRRVPEAELPEVFGSADAVVLPFREITTSGSALLALSYGRPLVLPRGVLPGLPAAAALRYDGAGLTRALAEAAALDRDVLEAMSRAALDHAARTSWPAIGEATASAFHGLLPGGATDGERT
ncbi:glycosyltransferase [Actinocorallia sp. B10E7]|uniref:glycosyltransferase n=1 Tax=Actinocorallia sp. B10E7 TaxID=3153558 RepID=UPI00325CC5E7